jgi:hypothetical protein
MVCRKEGIVGCEKEARRAQGYIGPFTTSKARGARIVLMRTGDHVYLHSNFVSVGAEHPTKISVPVSDKATLRTLALNVAVWGGTTSSDEKLEVTGDLLSNAQFIVDRSVFSDPGLVSSLELYAAQRLFVTDSAFEATPVFSESFSKNGLPNSTDPETILKELFKNSGLSKGGPHEGRPFDPGQGEGFDADEKIRPLRRLDSSSTFIESADGFLYSKVTGAPFDGLDDLNLVPIDPSRLKLISLVLDTATDKAIGEVPEEAVGAFDAVNGQLRTLFEAHAGHTLVFVGHVDEETGEYLVEDARGDPLRRIPLSELARLGRELEVNVIPLGCHSGLFGPVGAGTAFNSIAAVKRFGAARASRTMYDFLRTLSGNELLLVVAGKALDAARQRQTAEQETEATRGDSPLAQLNVFVKGAEETPTGTVRVFAKRQLPPLPLSPLIDSDGPRSRTRMSFSPAPPQGATTPVVAQPVPDDDTLIVMIVALVIGASGLVALWHHLRS